MSGRRKNRTVNQSILGKLFLSMSCHGNMNRRDDEDASECNANNK